MNIVYATRAAVPYPSAASLNTVQMCESLCRLGHHVTLAVGRKFWRWVAITPRFREFYGFTPSFHIQRLFELPRAAWGFDDAVVRLAQRTSSFVYLRYPRLLPRLSAAKISSLLELHSRLNADDAHLVQSALDSGYLRGVIVITDALKRDLMTRDEMRQHAARIFVAPDAVDVDRFAKAPCHARTSVGYVGSLYHGKGIELIEQIAAEAPELPIEIYGGSPREVNMHRRRNRESDNLVFHGRVAPADVPQCMSRFQIALLPNQPCMRLPSGDDIGQFTSPMKLFEYMAAGHAIVASDLPNLREVLEHERNALLVPHDSASRWIDAVRRLQSDSQLRRRLAQTARQEAAERFSYDVRFRKILAQFAFDPLHAANEEMAA